MAGAVISGIVSAVGSYAAAKQSAKANTAATKMQTDSANRTAELQLIAEREAAEQEAAAQAEAQDFLKQQWAASEAAAAPYRNLASGALGKLGSFMGLPAGAVSMPSSSPFPTSASSGASSTAKANTQYTDPTFVQGKVNEGFQQLYGRDATADEMAQWKGYMLTPDTFSDNKVRVGWNPYWQDRLLHPGASSSGVAAGDETVIGSQQPTGGTSSASRVIQTMPLIGAKTASATTPTTQSAAASSVTPLTSGLVQDEKQVWMMAPDGSVNRVKASLVPRYLAKGGKVLQA